MDTLIRGLVADGAVRVLAVDATRAARETAAIHGLGVDAATVAAECLVAGLLMSAHISEDERITLQVQASQPRFSFVADVKGTGEVRARISPTAIRHAGGPIEGVLIAIKSNSSKELYRGATPIEGTSIEQALRRHLSDSDQVRTIISLCARHDGEELGFVGGYLVEPLPFSTELPSLSTEAFHERYAVQRDAEEVLVCARAGEFDEERLQIREDRSLTWVCSCDKDRVQGMLVGLGSSALLQMAEEDGGAEVSCHFCGHRYTFSADQLTTLAEATSQPD